MKSTISRQSWVFLSSIIGGGLISLVLGRDLGWDMANYHFYNPFAFFHHREMVDYWPPSFFHRYLNPLLDIPNYLLIQYAPVNLTVFTLGAVHGINFYLLYLIAKKYIGTRAPNIALLIAFTGICGPIALPCFGATNNDALVSLGILGFVLLAYELRPNKSFFLGSMLIGIVCGLKLTCAIYFVGGVISLLLLPISYYARAKLCMVFIVGSTCGCAISAGFWMYHLWVQFHNPVFPFLNGIFHSPDFNTTNWTDDRFKPDSLIMAIFYPFYFSYDGRISDQPFRDFRFAIVYFLLALVIMKLWLRRGQPKGDNISDSPAIKFFILFFVTSYIVWQSVFSIARYMLPLELLSPLMIYLLLATLFKEDFMKLMTMSFVILFLVLSLEPAQFVRFNKHTDSYFNVHIPGMIKAIPQADVITAYPAFALNGVPHPQTYLIPFFPKNWRFIGIQFHNMKYVPDQDGEHHIMLLLKQSATPKFLLTDAFVMPHLYQVAAKFGYTANGPCMQIQSDRQAIKGEDVVICPIKPATYVTRHHGVS